MKNKYLLEIVISLFLLFSFYSFSQNSQIFWTKISKNDYSKNELKYRKTEPNKAEYYNLDIEALKSHLEGAPNRKNKLISNQKFIDIPNSDDSFETYSILEASVLDPELQHKYPNIRTYVGKSTKNPSNTIRFSITPQGFHSMSFISGSGTEFIDPYSNDASAYIIYRKRDLPVLNTDWSCEFKEEPVKFDQSSSKLSSFNANDGKMREFRLALACTIEYSEFHWSAAGLSSSASIADKKAAVLAAMVVTINRNNFIYERDLSLTMTLIANNEDIIFIDSDNFSNDNSGNLIDESQDVIDDIIGFTNYDIGHTFSTGGGGLASLNAPCTGSKARGITGSSSPVGDPYDVDFVAHEFGHQFGAPHTFNGNSGGCGPNRSATNAYEPGSGSTIMGYAGLCSPQNVQPNSDAYFHQKSLQMMWDNITIGSSTCATQTTTGNTAPIAIAGDNYNIPASTPYKLSGASTDVDGINSHTYTWEQYDLGAAGDPVETNPTGPLIRSYEGTNSSIRYVPRLSDLLTSGGTSTEWEKLASVDRDINFKLTVRDNDTRGGQTASDQMTATVVSSAGPFIVTSQNVSGQSWIVGSTETITWDVSGTTSNGINEANVDILFSTDGINYDIVLATGVPNDGSHDIVVPNVVSGNCRVMVAASSNIFFNINTQDIIIGIEEVCETYPSSDSLGLEIPDGVAANTPGNPLLVSLDVTDDITISDVNLNIDITHTYIEDLVIVVQHPDGTQAVVFDRNCGDFDNLDITFDDEATSEIICESPTVGVFQSVGTSLSNFNGLSSSGTWLIGIYDYYNEDVGVLNDWYLEICSQETLSTQLSNKSNDLVVYPNPSGGTFAVGFNSKSGDDIVLQIVDIQGRLIYNDTFMNKIELEEIINLNHVKPGVYFLQISDGLQKSNKKIIVK